MYGLVTGSSMLICSLDVGTRCCKLQLSGASWSCFGSMGGYTVLYGYARFCQISYWGCFEILYYNTGVETLLPVVLLRAEAIDFVRVRGTLFLVILYLEAFFFFF